MYIQNNNPFKCTPCGRRRNYMMVDNTPLKKVAKSWTQSDRDKFNRENNANLKPPQPEGGARKDSYCARSAGIPKCKNPDENNDCPNDIARRKWGC